MCSRKTIIINEIWDTTTPTNINSLQQENSKCHKLNPEYHNSRLWDYVEFCDSSKQ